MRKILTHFSRNFAKIAKEKSTSNCLLYEALYYIQTFSGSGHEKTQLMKLTILREIDWSPSLPYEKNFVKSPNFLLAQYSVEVTVKRDHKIYGKMNIFSVKLTFSLKNLLERVDFTELFVLLHFHTAQCVKTRNSISLKKIRQINYFFRKTIAFTKEWEKISAISTPCTVQ